MLGFYSALKSAKEEWLKSVLRCAERYQFIVIYGAGRVAKPIVEYLDKNNCHISCFTVTDMRVNESVYMGRDVRQIDELDYPREDTLFIIAMKEIWAKEARDKLISHGYENYIYPPHGIDYFAREERDNVYRPMMEITTVAGCAINCRFCPQTLFLKEYYSVSYRPRMMTLDTFKKCLEKLPGNTVVSFCGFSEPFLNPETVQMIRWTAHKGYDIELYTTLVGIDISGLKLIEDIPFRYVVLHVPDKEGYASIPMNEEYFNTLQYALEMKKPDGTKFIDTASGQGETHPDVIKLTEGRLRIITELYDRAGNLEEQAELTVTNKVDGRIYCSRVNDRLNYNVLLPDGTVLLCNMDFGLKNKIGNLLYNNYDEIINGERIREIVKKMDEKDNNLICRKCNFAVPVKRLKKGGYSYG